MAENMMGTSSFSWGGVSSMSLPFSSRRMPSGREPRYTRVSMGSRRGSMEGLVTWEALMSSLSQYTGRGAGLPMAESSTPPDCAWR